MSTHKQLIIYTDGASKGNPGPAAIGVVICDEAKKPVRKISKFIGSTTNNVAEYAALIFGLQECLALGCKEVTVYTDSELLAKQVNKEYKVKDKDLKPFYEIVKHLIESIGKVEVRHTERENNKEADKLANDAIDELF